MEPGAIKLKPFNEPQQYTGGTEYGTCIYSNLFTVLKSHNKDIYRYISNNIFVHQYNSQESDLRDRFGMEILQGTSLAKLYSTSGIKVEKHAIAYNDIIDFIREKVAHKIPVTVGIDMFYLPFRKDRYKKIHSLHYLMIFDYCPSNNTFKIIDNPQNKEYYELTMSIDDFLNAYQSALSEENSLLYTYICYDSETKYATPYYAKNYLINLQKYKCQIFNGIDSLFVLLDEFSTIVSNPSLWLKNKDNLFYLIHYHIINRKYSEKYAYYLFLNHSKILSDMDIILKKWTYVRNICLHFQETEQYSLEKANFAINELKSICVAEKESKSYIFSLIK